MHWRNDWFELSVKLIDYKGEGGPHPSSTLLEELARFGRLIRFAHMPAIGSLADRRLLACR